MVIEATQLFILELVHAANNADELTKPEKAYLLRQAASQLAKIRNQMLDAKVENEGTFGDPVHDLNEAARLIDAFGSPDIARELMSAAATLNAALMLLEGRTRY